MHSSNPSRMLEAKRIKHANDQPMLVTRLVNQLCGTAAPGWAGGLREAHIRGEEAGAFCEQSDQVKT